MTAYSFAADLLKELDGFRVEFDEAHERADIVLHRPPMNIVSMRQRDQVRAVFETLDADDRVRVIVLRAEGANFSSGGNIAGFMEASPEHVSELARNIAAPERCRKPVIAQVRGYCFGVGFELSLACDFRIASETAQFALPEMRIGMIPGSGGSARLLHMIGIARTKDMVMRAKRIPGRKAAEWGFVTECVADAELEATVDALAEELRGFSPLAQRTIKGVLNSGNNVSVNGAIEIEGQAYGRLRGSEDFKEGVASFHEKRKPVFTGK
ncbi:enoyl-CoA hydratase/isomerase family protein [Azospirillum sp. RWY-5-1]|uniref:Enoyl-CoA hydratase/isomerase family protein n=1 Tax=Azospirillum oleiclasticum TaxID=2735135 RepID=A0ABX2T925_9PROT|nr:enoyl-CoA hydratase-related protein [Azospirillum oleiclasticum]NYZ13416.1 enoyl-CoA hydratase/isomerase family protein [Azospirillum oleiclasticum]NYZ20577.1 enoyl-CoA hydratase/isomerase family protein [Azospirillum oleiclasticum]